MKIKVAFNIKPLLDKNRNRGVGGYADHLLKALKKSDQVSIFEFEDKEEVGRVDLVHYPFFDLFKRTLSIKGQLPTVVTVHDIIPLVFPNHYPPGVRGRINNYLQVRSLKAAQAVITDSRSSAQDIYRMLKISNNKIHTIYLSASENFQIINDREKLLNVKKRLHLPDNFALYVGNVNWNKNLNNLTRACIDLGLDIVLIGDGFGIRENLDHPEIQSFQNFLRNFSTNTRVHILGFVDEDDLVAVMNLSTLLLLVSFYEGFGLPILEAMSCGTPVITSSVSSMPEVGGDAAIYVDPYDVNNIKKGIKSLISNKTLRDKMVKKGLNQAQKFSWDKTALETIKVYQGLVKVR